MTETYLKVIDVSRHQGEMDMAKAKSAGVIGVAIRATVGDYYTDPMFALNWRKAKEVGLFRTAYHVTRPRCPAKAQIDRFKAVVGGRRPHFGKLGWVADNECDDDASLDTKHNVIMYALNELTAHAGKLALNYTRTGWFNENVKRSSIWAKFPLWVARYGSMSEPWCSSDPSWLIPLDYKDWAIWQWSADGNKQGLVHGASSPDIDLNRAKKWIFEAVLPEPEPEPEPEFQPYLVRVTASVLNLRRAPSGTDVGDTYQNCLLLIDGQQGDWLSTKLWVHKNYVVKYTRV